MIVCCLRCIVFFNLYQASAEALKHSLYVASFLHGDDTGVILLIDPHKEGLLMIVPRRRLQQFSAINKADPFWLEVKLHQHSILFLMS